MTQLYNIYWLKKEAEQMQREIDNIKAICKELHSPELTQRAENFISYLQAKKEEQTAEAEKQQSRIDNIEDEEIKEIASLLFLHRQTYQVIADKFYMDRTTVSRKLKKYFKRSDA